MLVLMSTVVAPMYSDCTIIVESLSKDQFLSLLPLVEKSYCGHPLTVGVLREYCPRLPEAVRGEFWDGHGAAIAARPRGGVRGSSQKQDTRVTIDDLEFCRYHVEGAGHEGI